LPVKGMAVKASTKTTSTALTALPSLRSS
jgi:hypothetical protein